MSKFKRFLVTAAAVVLGLGAVAVAATPAQAAYTSCTPTLAGCFFYDSNGNGAIWDIPYSYGCKNFTAVWNDKVSSIRWQSVAHGVNTGILLQWWENNNCSGINSQWWAPSATAHNGNMSGPWNDEASSYAIYDCQVDPRC